VPGLCPADWTPRELRHSFVSLLSDAGVPLGDIAQFVGHSDTSVTELVYRHQIRPVIQTGAMVMDRLEAKMDAEAWLTSERRLIESDGWLPPGQRGKVTTSVTLAEYAKTRLADRTLKPRTREHYRSLLDKQILPTLGSRTLRTLTPATVRAWHAELGTRTSTLRAHAYGLLRSILGSAVRDGLITQNPCHLEVRI
jgi:hypothetical protein